MNTISELHKKVDEWKVKGFLANDEAEALWTWAREVTHLAPCLEIGSYCGKSSVYLASACKYTGSALYALDHHRGSEEHQEGEQYHDSDLFDRDRKCMDSFPEFRQTLALFDLCDVTIPVVSRSEVVARHWHTPLSMVFVDGGHSPQAAMHDCLEWSKHVVAGGIMAVHDIFENVNEGGQGPYLAVQRLLQEARFVLREKVNSLGILQRV